MHLSIEYELTWLIESWIDLASAPSSTSLSSATDEIITTGLTVQHDSNAHRRQNRRSRGGGQFSIGTGHRVTAGGNSSQEEYEESESESDRVMTSSNEAIGPSPLRHPQSVASSETMSEREDDDDGLELPAPYIPSELHCLQFPPTPLTSTAFQLGESTTFSCPCYQPVSSTVTGLYVLSFAVILALTNWGKSRHP